MDHKDQDKPQENNNNDNNTDDNLVNELKNYYIQKEDYTNLFQIWIDSSQDEIISSLDGNLFKHNQFGAFLYNDIIIPSHLMRKDNESKLNKTKTDVKVRNNLLDLKKNSDFSQFLSKNIMEIENLSKDLSSINTFENELGKYMSEKIVHMSEVIIKSNVNIDK